MHTLRVDLDDELLIVSDITAEDGNYKRRDHAISLTVPNVNTTDQIFLIVNSVKPFRVQNEWPKDTDGLEPVVYKQVKASGFPQSQQLTWTNNTIKGPIYSVAVVAAVDEAGANLDITAELAFN